jgi:predicted dehydrogenase
MSDAANQMSSYAELQQAWPKPSRPLPVVCVGAGGIARAAHLPAYRAVGIPVRGVFDQDLAAANTLAQQFEIERVFSSFDEAIAEPGALFDLAVPPSAFEPMLQRLPVGAAVLIQKPMGENLEQARRILELCRERQLIAAVNFQLRFSPNMLALAAAIRTGLLGDVVDVEVRVNTRTPWELWPFLRGLPRHEIVYHSIHYLDLLRALLGEPRGVYAKAVRHPALPDYADTRSAVILDYGDWLRATVSAYHSHDYGLRHAVSEVKVEGTRGCAVARVGVNLSYPDGLPDTLEIAKAGSDFESVALRGAWFPEAFEGTMSNLQRFATGEDRELVTSVSDAFKTMALTEVCYQSSAAGGVPIPST